MTSQPERRTLIRLPADPAQADVLRGERSPWDGPIVDPDDKLDRDDDHDAWLDRADAAMDERDFDE